MRSFKIKISVIGLGKVGSAMLAVFASKGYDVIGFDVDPKVRDYTYYSNVLEKGLFNDVSHVFIAHPVEKYYDFVRTNDNCSFKIIDPWGKYN